MSLRVLQQSFAEGLQRDVSSGLCDSGLHKLIVGGGISPERRLNIYRNNFRTSLCDALADTFPVVRKLVGADFFRYLFDEYLRARPARSGDIYELGRYLPEFLGGFEAASKLPYLVDVARLEWAYHAVFHSSAPKRFEQKTLEHVAPAEFPNLILELGSACRFLCSPFPIFRIWAVNQDGYTGDGNTDLDDGPQTVLVVRPESDVEIWCLNEAESTFVAALSKGHSLGRAVRSADARSPDFDFETALEKFVRSGALVFKKVAPTS